MSRSRTSHELRRLLGPGLWCVAAWWASLDSALAQTQLSPAQPTPHPSISAPPRWSLDRPLGFDNQSSSGAALAPAGTAGTNQGYSDQSFIPPHAASLGSPMLTEVSADGARLGNQVFDSAPRNSRSSATTWFDQPRSTAPRISWASSADTPSTGSSAPVSGVSVSNASPQAASNNERELWAPVPQTGAHFFDPHPEVDCGVVLLEPHLDDFSPDPIYAPLPYEGEKQIDVYAGKKLYATQMPLLQWGREQYGPGQFPRSLTFLGETNLVTPQLLVYGDFRSALAANRVNGDSRTVWANRLNLDIDFEITSTERVHAFMGPLDNGAEFTRLEYDAGNARFVPQFDADVDFAFFEGDAGAIWGGLNGQVLPFTLPFAAGVFPMFVQNGYWLNDAFLGTAVTIPARNSALLDIANYDVTFFTAFDNVSSPAFGPDDNAVKVYGATSWIEAYNGYIELGYGFVDDRTLFDRNYHSISAAYSRRYGALLSNSVRVIANAGQEPTGIPQTADGVFVVLENSLITSNPWTVVPYFNLYAGFDRPQSLARAPGAGGILNHVGINFETDGLTGYPTLDASANNTWGGAIGLNLLPQDFSQQLVTEFAFVQAFGDSATRIAPGDQYGLGLRYQIPISNAVILRMDAMHGFLENADDVSGLRFEFRHKF